MNLALVLSAAWVVTGVLAGWQRHRLRDDAEAAAEWSPPVGRPGLYDLAALYGGPARVVDSAAVTLVERGVLAIGAGGLLVLAERSEDVPISPGVEVAVRARVSGTKGVALSDVRSTLVRDPGVFAAVERAADLGLVVERGPAHTRLAWGAMLTVGTAIAAFIAWAVQGAGVVGFLVLAAGTWWIVAAVLPAPGMPSRRGLALKRTIKDGADAATVVDHSTVVTAACWLTAVHGIGAARKLSGGLEALTLPGDPKPKDGMQDHDWGFWRWFFDDDGDGCGGCGCG